MNILYTIILWPCLINIQMEKKNGKKEYMEWKYSETPSLSLCIKRVSPLSLCLPRSS